MPAPAGAHRCAAHGCQHQIPRGLVMCNDHWRRVPTKLRRAVWAAWRRAGRDNGAWQDWHDAVQDAVNALHEKQLKRQASADARTPPLF